MWCEHIKCGEFGYHKVRNSENWERLCLQQCNHWSDRKMDSTRSFSASSRPMIGSQISSRSWWECITNGKYSCCTVLNSENWWWLCLQLHTHWADRRTDGMRRFSTSSMPRTGFPMHNWWCWEWITGGEYFCHSVPNSENWGCLWLQHCSRRSDRKTDGTRVRVRG